LILVIKLGGKVVEQEESRKEIAGQIIEIHKRGHRLVVVHGGGKQLDKMSHRLGIPIVQHRGRRVTDKTTLELAIMVFSLLNRQLVATLIGAGVPALGVSAFEGKVTLCQKRPTVSVRAFDKVGGEHVKRVDFGLVGDILDTDPAFLQRMWKENFIPVISCLGADSTGQILNINADTLAAEIAIGLQATQLFSVSDVPGIYLNMGKEKKWISKVTDKEVETHLHEGRFTGGMVPKVQAALKVLASGVGSVRILSGLQEGALLRALDGKAGTMIHREGLAD